MCIQILSCTLYKKDIVQAAQDIGVSQNKKISRSRSNLSHGRRKFAVVREYSFRSIKTVVLYTERVLNTKDKKVYQLEEYITLE